MRSCPNCGAVGDSEATKCNVCGAGSTVAPPFTSKEQLDVESSLGQPIHAASAGADERSRQLTVEGSRPVSGDLRNGVSDGGQGAANTAATDDSRTTITSDGTVPSADAGLGRSPFRQPGRGYGYRARMPAHIPSVGPQGVTRVSRQGSPDGASHLHRLQPDGTRSGDARDTTTMNVNYAAQKTPTAANPTDLEHQTETVANDGATSTAIAADSSVPASRSAFAAPAQVRLHIPLEGPQVARRRKAWVPILTVAVAGLAITAYLYWEKSGSVQQESTQPLGPESTSAAEDKAEAPRASGNTRQESKAIDGAAAPEKLSPAASVLVEQPASDQTRAIGAAESPASRQRSQARKSQLDAIPSGARLTPEPVRVPRDSARPPVEPRACTDAIRALGLCDSAPTK